MSILDQAWFSRIERPSRYIGNEINSVRKEPGRVEVSMALAFPDIYEVGMSHLGLKILYHILNGHDWLAAERVFCPWVDLEEALRQRKLPLTATESGRSLAEFDIVGFSLQNELSFSNVLTMLDLSGIPFLSKDREAPFPLIIAGGPACFNPEPVAALFDAVVIGDGEEAALEICKRVREWKGGKDPRKGRVLRDLTEIEGVYVPAFFDPEYGSDGTLSRIEPKLPGYEAVRKAVVSDINRYPFPNAQVVPFAELVHDRFAIEISRGCTRGCRFCQAGMIYRPVRERHPMAVMENAEKGLKGTGFEELSLLSLSSGDYSCISTLLQALMDRQSEDRVAVSFPSLRVDSLDPLWLEQIKRVRKTGFTLAPEAGNDRLRRVINKGLTNQEILNMAREVFGAGWNLIKLYFMIGLPGEKEGDVEDIISLAKEVVRQNRGKNAKINVSVAAFVPKSHTPFMWVPQVSLEESRGRIRKIRDALRDHRRVRVKWNQPEMSWLEGIFSRGDRRLTGALIEAWRSGARFDAWGEHFNKALWEEALRRSGLDPNFYLYRSRSLNETLPWGHIQSGVTAGYLKKEWKRALEGVLTPDCREKCLECGVCDHDRVAPVLHRTWSPPAALPPVTGDPSGTIRKYRITFSKTDGAKHLSHLELVRLFIRAFRRAGLQMAFSKGFHPKPKVSFATALPVGTESLHETVDIQTCEAIPHRDGRERIGRQLPSGINVLFLEDITRETGKVRLRESHFLITLDGVEPARTDLEKFLQSVDFPIIKKGKNGEQIINARPLVAELRIVPPSEVKLVINHLPGPELKPADLVQGVFHLKEDEVGGIKVLKTHQVMR